MSQRHYPPDIFDGLASSDSDVERILDKFEDLLFDNRDEAIYKLNDLVSYERPEVVRLVLSRMYFLREPQVRGLSFKQVLTRLGS